VPAAGGRSFLHARFRRQIDKVEMCMAAKAQCIKTGVHVGPIAAGITPASQGCSRPPRPTTPPHGAMQRGRRRRGKSGGPPRPREQIRLPQGPVSACKLPRQIRLGPVEPFSFRPDKNLPGTLHHSGNRPAPPSDYIPLARRSAFLRARQRGREFEGARGVEALTAGFPPCRGAANILVST
jgi:hypothetical protein